MRWSTITHEAHASLCLQRNNLLAVDGCCVNYHTTLPYQSVLHVMRNYQCISYYAHTMKTAVHVVME
jgi:hypothetical protein